MYGEKLLEGKSVDFQREAVLQFMEFDRLMSMTQPEDSNYYLIGYATIVASLHGDFLNREQTLKRKEIEAQEMMSQLGGLLGGVKQ